MENIFADKLNDGFIQNRILEFTNTLEENKTVCKEDVLAFESFIGFPLITSDIDVNSITTARTKTEWGNILAVAKEAYKDIPLTNVPTLEDIATLADKVISNVKMISELITNISIIPDDMITRIKERSFCLEEIYANPSDEQYTLQNIYDTNDALNVFATKKGYVEYICNDVNKYSAINETVSTLVDSDDNFSSTVSFYPYMNILLKGKGNPYIDIMSENFLNLEYITLLKLIDISKIINDSNNGLIDVNWRNDEIIYNVKRAVRAYSDVDDLKWFVKTYRYLQLHDDATSNPNDLLLLNILAILAPKEQ